MVWLIRVSIRRPSTIDLRDQPIFRIDLIDNTEHQLSAGDGLRKSVWVCEDDTCRDISDSVFENSHRSRHRLVITIIIFP